ncbi:hypothetical protein RFI_02877, partial [Reticulomyxa filosa]
RLSKTKTLLLKMDPNVSNDRAKGTKTKPEVANLEKEMTQLQMDLFELDEQYRPIHLTLRKINAVETDMENYQENYSSKLGQLRRLHSRLNKTLEMHQEQRASAIAALQATEMQQGVMTSKISDRVAQTLLKIDLLKQQLEEAKQQRVKDQSYSTTLSNFYSSYFSTAQANEQMDQSLKSTKELELESELHMSDNFLKGLHEFLKGLKKLRAEQYHRITHIEQVVTQMSYQRAAVVDKIDTLEREATQKLDDIQHQFIVPLQQQIAQSKEYQQQHQQSQLQQQEQTM